MADFTPTKFTNKFSSSSKGRALQDRIHALELDIHLLDVSYLALDIDSIEITTISTSDCMNINGVEYYNPVGTGGIINQAIDLKATTMQALISYSKKLKRDLTTTIREYHKLITA